MRSQQNKAAKAQQAAAPNATVSRLEVQLRGGLPRSTERTPLADVSPTRALLAPNPALCRSE